MPNTHSPPPDTAQRTAWVTGAGTGIGRGLALRLAREGWNIAISARRAENLTALAAEAPDRLSPYPLDVTNEPDVIRTTAAIENDIGPPDLVILNAGTYTPLSATRFDTQAFSAMVATNLMGTAYCLGAIMPGMIHRRRGHIAVVASVAGYTGLPNAAAYGATKAALINMCQSLYPELAAEGVRISVINPGFVDTPLTRKNDFPMPFLISVETAVDSIMRGLESRRFDIVFPWKMALAMKFLALLPDCLRFAITRRLVRR